MRRWHSVTLAGAIHNADTGMNPEVRSLIEGQKVLQKKCLAIDASNPNCYEICRREDDLEIESLVGAVPELRFARCENYRWLVVKR